LDDSQYAASKLADMLILHDYRQFEQDVQSRVNTSSEDRVPAIRCEIEELVWELYKRGTEPVAGKSAAFRVNLGIVGIPRCLPLNRDLLAAAESNMEVGSFIIIRHFYRGF